MIQGTQEVGGQRLVNTTQNVVPSDHPNPFELEKARAMLI